MSDQDRATEISCIYCPPEKPATFRIGEGSAEHVILAALGGRKTTKNVCCADCNTRLGNEIDDVLAQNLAPLGNLFGIKRDRKGVAPTLSSQETLEGVQLEVAPGGKFQLRKATIKESTTEDGRIALQINANSVEQADHLLANYLNKFGQGLETTTEYVLKSTPAPALAFTLKFEGEQKRCATKMLLNMLATCVKPARIRSPDLRDAVSYIAGDSEIGYRVEPWLNMELPEVPTQYRFGHVALVAASAERKVAVGILILYGTIKVTALLSDSWSGPTLGSMYCIDPCTGESATTKFDAEEHVRTYPLSGRPSDTEFKADLDVMMEEIQRRHRTHRFLEKLQEIRDHLPPNASPERIRAAVAQAAEHLTYEFLQLPYQKSLNR